MLNFSLSEYERNSHSALFAKDADFDLNNYTCSSSSRFGNLTVISFRIHVLSSKSSERSRPTSSLHWTGSASSDWHIYLIFLFPYMKYFLCHYAMHPECTTDVPAVKFTIGPYHSI